MRRTAQGLRFNRELHGAVGIWSLVLFMLVNFTGVYLAFPQQISAAVNAVWPGRDMRAAMFQARIEPMRGAMPMGVNEAVELARSRVPDGRFLNAFLSTRPDQAVRVGLVRPGHARRRADHHGDHRSVPAKRGRRLRSADHEPGEARHRLAARAALRHRAGRRATSSWCSCRA